MLHVACGVGWMGADVVLAILMLTGWFSATGRPSRRRTPRPGWSSRSAVPVLAGGMLVTGVLLGIGTKYGLVQWWWVFVKLVIGVVLTVLVFVLLVPGAAASRRGSTGTADQVREQVGRPGRHLVFPPLVSFVALAFALVVSVFKPWGRTRWGRARVERQQREKVTTA